MQKQMTKFAGAAGSLMLVAGLLSAAIATPKTAGKTTGHKAAISHSKSSQVTGKVVAIKGDWLTITPTQSKMGTSRRILVPATAKITSGNRAIKLANVKPGHKVTVMMNGSKVTRVNCA